ncbi:MAG: RuvX/YqgF family protein [bacterium]
MFDYLCIDWGHLRCGLAFGDSKTGLVIPFVGNIDTKNLNQVLEKEIHTRKIKNIVIGRPTNFKMGNTEVTNKIEAFILELKLLYPGISFFTENERNSSKNAKLSGAKFDKFSINHLAAMQILQSYFEANPT